MFSSNLNSVCYRIWNSILVLGFGTALIFEFLRLRNRERREELPLQNYKPAASLPKSMRQLSAGWPKDTVRKNFPVLKGRHPIRKKQYAQKLVLIRTDVNASFARFFSVTCTERYLLPFCGGPHCTSATDRPIALWKLEQIQPGQMPAAFVAATSGPNSLSSVLLFFANRNLKGDI